MKVHEGLEVKLHSLPAPALDRRDLKALRPCRLTPKKAPFKQSGREISASSGIEKGKAVPLQAWSGPEGSRKLRFPDYMTKAQDVGKVVSLTHRPPLPPGNAPGTHFC
jgi:hypothetical protein